MIKDRKLQDIYKAIPAFSCKPGCSDCCGPVPLAKPEWQAIKMAKREVGIDCTSCDFLVEGKCSVYEDRPFLCRLFGATEDAKMACPHGCGPAKPLNKKQTGILTERYMKLMGSGQMNYTNMALHAELQSLANSPATGLPHDLIKKLV